MAPPVICVCSKCSRQTCLVKNIYQPGCLVSRKTRTRHAYEDRKMLQAESSSESEADAPSFPVEGASEQLKVFDFKAQVQLLVNFCGILVLWLHLHMGVSRHAGRIILKSLALIFQHLFQQIEHALHAVHIDFHYGNFDLHQDLQGLYRLHSIEPTLQRTACCQKCFTLYPRISDMPATCLFKFTTRSRPCGESLWRTKRTLSGGHQVPRCYYTTQNFMSWLVFFLDRQEIEDAIHITFRNKSTPTTFAPPPTHPIRDVLDSLAWRHASAKSRSPYHLLFGVYIDWFNPLTNKIAGKQVSCGAIVLYCFNLPPELRYNTENIFIVGLVPPPNQPDMYTISHILTPLVDMFLSFWPNSQLIPTFRHPGGIAVTASLLNLLADLMAIRKVAGFMAPTANLLCSYCLCTRDKIDDLELSGTWPLRDPNVVRTQANHWLRLKTKSAKEAETRTHGVRWTPLLRLPYWDPVNSPILGFMHNWLEGILANHLRTFWGIGRDAKTQKMLELQEREIIANESFSESDSAESGLDISELSQETMEWEASHHHIQAPVIDRTRSLTLTDSDDDEEETIPTHQIPDFDSSDDDDTEYGGQQHSSFTSEHLSVIHSCIRDIVFPTWVARPPANLGEEGHGKLKADVYLILFSVVLPIIMPEIWQSNEDIQLLQNFYHLVAATHIIISFATSHTDADRFSDHYTYYRASSKRLFPNLHSKPNHHFAEHYPAILKHWGPLAAISEFPGERLNGLLQRVSTNTHMDQMDLTMLRQMCRRARLGVKLSTTAKENYSSPISKLCNLLQPLANDQIASSSMTSSELKKFISGTKDIEPGLHYQLILQYVNKIHPCKAFYNVTGFADAVLPSKAQQPTEITLKDRTFSCQKSHEGNSAIQYKVDQEVFTGFIVKIYQTVITSHLQTYYLVSRHQKPLVPTIFTNMQYLQVSLVLDRPDNIYDVIEQDHIITHVAFYRRPIGTFGIDDKMLVVSWGLNRGRIL